MLKEYKVQSITGIWGGALFFALGYYFSGSSQMLYTSFGRIIMSAGYALFICGCFMYSKGKGRSFWWGILGVLGPLGLLVLYVLKDRSKIILKNRQKNQLRY